MTWKVLQKWKSKIKFYRLLARVRKKYIIALEKHQPVRCAISTNPSPELQFVNVLEEIEKGQSITTYKALVILDHLLNDFVWAQTVTSYNAQYTIGHAQEAGYLDKHLNPIIKKRKYTY